MTKQSRPDLGSKTPEIKTEKRKAVGGDCKESNIEGKSARKYSRRWDIIVTAFDFVTNFSESSISAYAGQAAFFLMLSFFPFLLFFFSLLSWTPLTEADFLMWASSFIPESFGDIMKDLASEVYASGTGRLSITMITAVYLSSKAFISFQLGLDDMYHVKENRNFILRRIYSVLYSIVFALALIFFTGYHGVWKYAQEDVFFECSSYNWKYNRQCGRLSSGNLPAGAYFIFLGDLCVSAKQEA